MPVSGENSQVYSQFQSLRQIKPSLRVETFAGKNFRDFRNFDPFSQKFLPGKKLNLENAIFFFRKSNFFPLFSSVKTLPVLTGFESFCHQKNGTI